MSRLRCWLILSLLRAELRHAERVTWGPWNRRASLRIDSLRIALEAMARA
jgi:hypothetical protein